MTENHLTRDREPAHQKQRTSSTETENQLNRDREPSHQRQRTNSPETENQLNRDREPAHGRDKEPAHQKQRTSSTETENQLTRESLLESRSAVSDWCSAADSLSWLTSSARRWNRLDGWYCPVHGQLCITQSVGSSHAAARCPPACIQQLRDYNIDLWHYTVWDWVWCDLIPWTPLGELTYLDDRQGLAAPNFNRKVKKSERVLV